MSQQEHLAARYGTGPARRRWLLLGAVSVVVAAFLAWVTWVVLHEIFKTEVRSELITFQILDEHHASAQVQVHVSGYLGEPDCLVRAVAEDHTVVGEARFQPTTGYRTYTQAIRTERLATSVELLGCTTPGQPRPR